MRAAGSELEPTSPTALTANRSDRSIKASVARARSSALSASPYDDRSGYPNAGDRAIVRAVARISVRLAVIAITASPAMMAVTTVPIQAQRLIWSHESVPVANSTSTPACLSLWVASDRLTYDVSSEWPARRGSATRSNRLAALKASVATEARRRTRGGNRLQTRRARSWIGSADSTATRRPSSNLAAVHLTSMLCDCGDGEGSTRHAPESSRSVSGPQSRRSASDSTNGSNRTFWSSRGVTNNAWNASAPGRPWSSVPGALTPTIAQGPLGNRNAKKDPAPFAPRGGSPNRWQATRRSASHSGRQHGEWASTAYPLSQNGKLP